MKNTNIEFQQGRVRKITEKNFYLTILYLSLQTYREKRLSDHPLKDEIRAFDDIAPHKKTSKANVDKLVSECEERISDCETIIFVDQFPIDKGICKGKDYFEKVIELNKSKIGELKDRYIELSDKMKFDLHVIVTKLEDDIYSAMTSWVKQNRLRAKEYKHQVTLSTAGKNALEQLKLELNANSYDETLIKLSREAR